MSTAYSPNGTRFYIGTAQTSVPADAAAYAAISYTEIGGVESIGDYGDEAQVLTASALADQRVYKVKGPRDAGTLTLTVLDRPDDTGQAAAITAEATQFMYAIKVVLPNQITVGGTGETEYFCALVSSKRLNVGNASNIVKRMFNLAINSAVTQVPAT